MKEEAHFLDDGLDVFCYRISDDFFGTIILFELLHGFETQFDLELWSDRSWTVFKGVGLGLLL